MTTIGFPLYQEMPQIDEAPAMEKICQHYTDSHVTIRIRDIEIDPRQATQVRELNNYGGRFVEIVADGPQEAMLAAALHQQLAKDKYSY